MGDEPGKGAKEPMRRLTNPVIDLTSAVIKSVNMREIITFHSSPCDTMMKEEVYILWVRAQRMGTLTYCT